MLTKRIIPCLDVKDGRVVKNTKFLLNTRDAGDPVELAAFYDAAGADELVFLDITASSDGRETVVDMVARTAEQVFIPFTIGGGIRTVADMNRMLAAGADKVSVNSAAVLNPRLIEEGATHFGSQCIVLAIDAKARENGEGWEVFVNGGRTATGLDALEWARQGYELGAGEIMLNSIDADGTKDGYDLPLNRAVSQAVGIPVIASGGAGNLQHLVEAVVEGQADAVLVASIFHFGEYTVRQAKEYMQQHSLPIRL